MLSRRPFPLAAVLAAVLALVGGVASAGQDAAAPFRVEPDRITVGAFYRGATVHVSGPVEPATDVIVVMTAGQLVEEHYNRKGRLGPFWATVGKVTIAGLPALHLVASGAPVPTLLSEAEVDTHLMSLDALARRADVQPAGGDRETVVAEYLKLKQGQGVVGLFEGAVQLRGASGNPSFDATIPWPASAPAGHYQVVVRHVRDHRVISEAARSIEVAYVGLPRLIAHLAFDRSLLYGVLAVLIALSVGFIMGLLFKRGTAGH